MRWYIRQLIYYIHFHISGRYILMGAWSSGLIIDWWKLSTKKDLKPFCLGLHVFAIFFNVYIIWHYGLIIRADDKAPYFYRYMYGRWPLLTFWNFNFIYKHLFSARAAIVITTKQTLINFTGVLLKLGHLY